MSSFLFIIFDVISVIISVFIVLCYFYLSWYSDLMYVNTYECKWLYCMYIISDLLVGLPNRMKIIPVKHIDIKYSYINVSFVFTLSI